MNYGEYKHPKAPTRPKKECQNCNNHLVDIDKFNYCPICGKDVISYKSLMAKYKEDMKKWREDCNKIDIKFKKDALKYVGIDPGHPKADILFNIAWEYGYDNGYHSIVYHMEDLAKLID